MSKPLLTILSTTLFLALGVPVANAAVYGDWAQCTKALEAQGKNEVCVADSSMPGYFVPASEADKWSAVAGDNSKKSAESSGRVMVPEEKKK